VSKYTRTRIVRLAALTAFLPLLCLAGRQDGQDARPALQHRDDNRIVLSRHRLDPPLRSGNRRVRFSPDGKYILLQDDSGIRIFSHEPLEEKTYVSATRVLPAVFTADSQNVVISSPSLEVAIVSVDKNRKVDPKPLSSSLKTCQAAVLSPMGNALGCFDYTFKLHLLGLPAGQELVSSQLFNLPSGLFALRRLPSGSAFSEPFGYVVTNSIGFVFDRNPSTGNLVFSPDGRYLIAAGFGGDLIAFDARNGQKFNLPGSLRHRRATSLRFSGSDQVAILDPQKPDDSVLLSFPDGKMLKKIGLSGLAQDTSAAGYLVYNTADASDSGIFELQEGKSVLKLSDPAADVYGRDVATFTADGNLVLSHLDNSPPQTVPATAGLLPMLQVAAVSPDTSSLALSTGGEGAVYRAADGKRAITLENIEGGWCVDSSCYLWLYNRGAREFELQDFSVSSSETSKAWSRPRPDNKQGMYTAHTEYFPSATVLFQHSMNVDPESCVSAVLASQASSLASVHMSGFSLRALDTRSGDELWKRGFESDPAVPFSDPQGDRFVLGWKAASPGGRRTMKDNPAATEAFKHDKQANKDSYFEVLDPRTGKSLGGVLAQIDSTPEEFDSAFSEGDWLVLAKDGQRVFVFSLSSGQEVLKLFGWRPTLNAATSTLCLSTQADRLTTYDLKTGEKLHDYNFATAIVYAHFSADGQKLLALTEDQMLYVLDTRRATAAAKNN
jgi:WD40 repeat protein